MRRIRVKLLVVALTVAAAISLFSLGYARETRAVAAGGIEIFKDNCARCHGNDGKGGDGPDLTDPQRKDKWKDSDERIIYKVTNGGRRMPSFADKLSSDDIKAVAAFVRSL